MVEKDTSISTREEWVNIASVEEHMNALISVTLHELLKSARAELASLRVQEFLFLGGWSFTAFAGTIIPASHKGQRQAPPFDLTEAAVSSVYKNRVYLPGGKGRP